MNCMEKEIQVWLDRHAENYRMCLKAASTIPTTTIGEELAQRITVTEEFLLNREDYRQIATSLYIQANKAGLFRVEGDPGPPRDSQDDSPITSNQLDFINTLCRELGKEADEILDQQLRLCSKTSLTVLTKQEATEIITILKAEKNKSK